MIPPEELAAMRADPVAYISDLPSLIAEVERLRCVAEAAKAVRDSIEANGVVVENYECVVKLVAALDAAEGGE